MDSSTFKKIASNISFGENLTSILDENTSYHVFLVTSF